ncbi:MAG: DUF4256 domain-containing protein [Micrococcaceae bacterium]
MPKTAPKTKPKEIIKEFPQKLTAEQKKELLETLETRFNENSKRHDGIKFSEVEEKLTDSALAAAYAMEITEGEPDIVQLGKKLMLVDCAAESPKGRRSVCYDQEALDKRKRAKPQHSAVAMAKDMGIELLDEEQYRALQEIEEFDAKTSSWVKTPPAMREKGGALFGDFRYGQVFFYHNGAESYYSARGFRGAVEL